MNSTQAQSKTGAAVSAWFLALVWLSSIGAAMAAERLRMDLNGQWQFRLDPRNEGETSRWYSAEASFPDSIQVPGCWQAQGFGERAGILRHHYAGHAWYLRSVTVPSAWRDKKIVLKLGGAIRKTTLFVNGAKVA